MKSPYLEKAAGLILSELKGIIPVDEYTEISARKNEKEKFTQSIFRTYQGEKISRAALEHYTINSKAYGLVLNIYPDPLYGIPIFTFQLGGQIPDKVIFILDIIPVNASGEDQALNDLFQKHASGMDHLGSTQEWLRQVCSTHALICQYKPMDPEKILSALTDYLHLWKELYYLPAKPVLDEEARKQATENILKFKTVLHANDAGLEIYQKKFGKAISFAIEQTAFGSELPLEKSAPEANATQDVPDSPSETDSRVKWTKEAEEYLLDAPRFVRSSIQSNAEKKALQLGVREITRRFIEDLRK